MTHENRLTPGNYLKNPGDIVLELALKKYRKINIHEDAILTTLILNEVIIVFQTENGFEPVIVGDQIAEFFGEDARDKFAAWAQGGYPERDINHDCDDLDMGRIAAAARLLELHLNPGQRNRILSDDYQPRFERSISISIY